MYCLQEINLVCCLLFNWFHLFLFVCLFVCLLILVPAELQSSFMGRNAQAQNLARLAAGKNLCWTPRTFESSTESPLGLKQKDSALSFNKVQHC